MKLLESIKQIISEASKKKILMDKIGFNEDNVDLLDKLCGPLSVWMGNKMMEYQQQFSDGVGYSWIDPPKQGQELIDQMNACAAKTNDASWRIVRRKSAGDVSGPIALAMVVHKMNEPVSIPQIMAG